MSPDFVALLLQDFLKKFNLKTLKPSMSAVPLWGHREKVTGHRMQKFMEETHS